MRKLRQWLRETYLPAYVKEDLLEENRQLREQIRELKAEVSRLNAYADGLEFGLRRRSRVTINTGGERT